MKVLEVGNQFNITHPEQRSCKTSYLTSANSLTPTITDRGQAIQRIDASAEIRGTKFSIPLFCDTGASIDITSAKTVRKRGINIDYRTIPQKIVDVQGNTIKLLGTATFYLHHEGHIRRLVVTVADNLGRDDEIVLSLGTLRQLGIIEEIGPKINTAKFAEGQTLYNDIYFEGDEAVNSATEEEPMSEKDKLLNDMKNRLIKGHEWMLNLSL